MNRRVGRLASGLFQPAVYRVVEDFHELVPVGDLDALSGRAALQELGLFAALGQQFLPADDLAEL